VCSDGSKLKEIMGDSKRVTDEKITGKGKDVDGSTPKDSRPNGKGWTTDKVPKDSKDKPFISVVVASPEFPVTTIRTIKVEGNVKTVNIEYKPPGSDQFKVLQPGKDFEISTSPEIVLKEPVEATEVRIVLVDTKDDDKQFKNVKVSVHVCDGKLM
jgi:hypothetical protein